MELAILSNLTKDEEYARKVVPFIKAEYFQNVSERIVFNKISEYMDEYSNVPNNNTLLIELGNDQSIVESDYTASVQLIESFKQQDNDHDREWLVDKTEQYCQEKAVYNAIMESIHIIDGKSKEKAKDAIPSILSDALAVSFDNTVGHDFLNDYEQRYDFYHRVEERVPFDLEYLNSITKGGVPRKTLNIILAGTGVGKSLAMCHFAANNGR